MEDKLGKSFDSLEDIEIVEMSGEAPPVVVFKEFKRFEERSNIFTDTNE